MRGMEMVNEEMSVNHSFKTLLFNLCCTACFWVLIMEEYFFLEAVKTERKSSSFLENAHDGGSEVSDIQYTMYFTL